MLIILFLFFVGAFTVMLFSQEGRRFIVVCFGAVFILVGVIALGGAVIFGLGLLLVWVTS